MIYNIKEISGKYKTQGRTSIVNDLLMIDHTVSGIEFNVCCGGDVFVTFVATEFSSLRYDDKQFASYDSGSYFTVIVDGKKHPYDTCGVFKIGENQINIAKNLEFGNHNIKIIRNNELVMATIGIKSISLDGRFIDTPKNKDLFIEFVGDSITAAYGNMVYNNEVDYEGSKEPRCQDATNGYAYLTATALDADYAVIARSGIGAHIGWAEYTMQDYYPALRYTKDNQTMYNFSRKADVVVLALGTNDVDTYLRHNMTLEDVKQGFKKMLSLVKSKNPDTKVVWIYDMMRDEANPLVTDVMEEAGGIKKGYYTLKVKRDNNGGHTHPHYTAHIEIAKKLSGFIRSNIL